MDHATLLAAAVAITALAVPVSVGATGLIRSLVVSPSSRLGGIVVLCAAISSLGRSPVADAALPPPMARAEAAPAAAPVDAALTARSPAVRAEARHYTVQPGDSLWAIACRLLDTSETESFPADIDRTWRAIYAANRVTIGDDPDLIFPGTSLTLPDVQA